MSFILQGIGVSEGIAIGHAHLAAPSALEVMHYLISKQQVDKEISRLNKKTNAISMVYNDMSSKKHLYTIIRLLISNT